VLDRSCIELLQPRAIHIMEPYKGIEYINFSTRLEGLKLEQLEDTVSGDLLEPIVRPKLKWFSAISLSKPLDDWYLAL
jgi:hypothetical protein